MPPLMRIKSFPNTTLTTVYGTDPLEAWFEIWPKLPRIFYEGVAAWRKRERWFHFRLHLRNLRKGTLEVNDSLPLSIPMAWYRTRRESRPILSIGYDWHALLIRWYKRTGWTDGHSFLKGCVSVTRNWRRLCFVLDGSSFMNVRFSWCHVTNDLVGQHWLRLIVIGSICESDFQPTTIHVQLFIGFF